MIGVVRTSSLFGGSWFGWLVGWLVGMYDIKSGGLEGAGGGI